MAPAGTIAVTPVELQLVTLAAIPLNATVLVPWVEPKSDPVMVTDVPGGPSVGDSANSDGTFTTVKLTGLLGTLPTLTTTLPEVPATGTVPKMVERTSL